MSHTIIATATATAATATAMECTVCEEDTGRSNKRQCSRECKKIATATRDVGRTRKSKKMKTYVPSWQAAPAFAARSDQDTSPAGGASLLSSAQQSEVSCPLSPTFRGHTGVPFLPCPSVCRSADRFPYVPSWQVFHVPQSPPWQAAPSQTFDHEYIIVNETQDVSQGFSPGFRHSSRHSRGSAAQSAQEDPVNVSQEDPISDSDSQETLDDMARHMQAQAQPQQAQSVSPGFSLGFRHSSSRGPAAQSAQED